MDFVEGRDLRHLLVEKGQVSARAGRLESCSRFAALWKRPTLEGVIHRDLKPHNIMWIRVGGRM